MQKFRKVIMAGIVLIFLGSVQTQAVTDIMEEADVRADPATVRAILATFDRAEEALKNESSSAIMAIYSNSYRNRGLGKEDTSRMWGDIFRRYDQLSSWHVFSKIVVDPGKKTAHITCTGALFGVSALKREGKPSPSALTGEPIHIDVWFEAIHHLVLEDGTWRIIGHDPAGGEEELFGASIHLLF